MTDEMREIMRAKRLHLENHLDNAYPRLVTVPTVFEVPTRRAPVHTHTHSFPIFAERRGDAGAVRIGLRCACGNTVNVDYLAVGKPS